MNHHRISPRRRLKQIGITNLVLIVLVCLTVGFFAHLRLKPNNSVTSTWTNMIEESKPDKETNQVHPKLIITDNKQPSAIRTTKKMKKHDELSCLPKYESCPKAKPGYINVHLIPHTHDDVGWRKTFEEYYNGSGNDTNPISVLKIIDSIIDELHEDPSRRFIYVEMAYFYKWWKEQSTGKKHLIKTMVASGRLEFINGGWCMNDEATTHYVDIIDQMSLGLIFLNETFGECGRPTIGWQIDPFGHSKEHASIISQLGFDGLVLGRIDYQDHKQRNASKNMEMVWYGDKNSGSEGGIFTSLLYEHYTPPNGFCFDGELNYCNDKPINDNPKAKEYDVKERITNFLKFCQQQANAYKTNNILIPMGNDFSYQKASNWFTNMDKLIEHGNKFKFKGESSSKFNIFYSTPSCYAKAVNDQNATWPIKTDDFFPYSTSPNSYWTGFYTSRPTLKYMVRQGSNLLQSCKQMASVMTMKDKAYKGNITVMKEAMAVMQHHDAVTGTEKQHVANDYARLLHIGIKECLKTATTFYEEEFPKDKTINLPKVSYCRLNLSACEVTEKSERFVVNVYNSLSRNIEKYIRVPIPDQSTSHQVFDSKGNSIDFQLVPILELVKELPDRESPSMNYELVFLAADLPPLGSKSFYVRSIFNEVDGDKRDQLSSTSSEDHIISNEKITITVDGKSGLLRSIKTDDAEVMIKQEFLWYAGRLILRDQHNNMVNMLASGAYTFRPNGTSSHTIPTEDKIRITVFKGALVEEIHQYYNDWLSQVIRIYKGQNHVEFDWIVGSIPTDDTVSKEIITRFTTSMKSNREFYTDSNGRQTLKRTINSRDSFKYNITEPVAGNYYPINSHIYLKDQKKSKQLTILVDRAQGGASLEEGQLELMVHRRLISDDFIGVDEALDERQSDTGDGIIARGTHYLMLGGNLESARLRPLLSQEIYKQPQISFISTELSMEDWLSRYHTEVQFLNHSLPDNVNLLTLEPHSNERFLIRLEHIYEQDENESLSAPVSVSLAGLFKGFEITSLEETTLGGNMWKKELNRLNWNTKSKNDKPSTNPIAKLDDFSKKIIVLHPMQIRSFILGVAKREQL